MNALQTAAGTASDITIGLFPRPIDNAAIERAEAALLKTPQAEVPLIQMFSDGIYCRQVFMRAGLFVIGHEHRTRHLNAVMQGRVSVMIDGEIREIVGPCIFESCPGVRKVLFTHTDTVWATFHVTNERDPEKLEEMMIIKSPSFLDHHRDLQTLREHVDKLP
jgi:hypothetical protein